MTAEEALPSVDLGRTEAYDYSLPPERIARYPAEQRDRSRLLTVERDASGGVGGEATGRVEAEGTRPFRDLYFADLPSLLRSGDLLVLNESRVLPARLLGRKPTGAECEVLLLRPAPTDAGARPADSGARPAMAPPTGIAPPADAARWEALVRPGAKLKPGRRIVVSPELEVAIEEGLPDGSRIVRLESPLPVREAIERYGRVPLPPYIGRDDEPVDRERYQTVYARTPGSVAAPTAGLHFTPELLDRARAGGVRVAEVTLHVGPGTFRPVDADRLDRHVMDAEHWTVSEEAAREIAECRRRGGRVWAVGTTVVRTLESAAASDGRVRAGHGETRLFIHPGFRFRVVDGLVTNFHLPKSTLLMLVAAFAGYRTTLTAYAHAVAQGYRFYSYGDAMVVTPAEGR